MDLLDNKLHQAWHSSINAHVDQWRKSDGKWSDVRFMYDGMKMADEVPRMAMLFRRQREDTLPKTHQQCSMQPAVPIQDNELTCCRGVKAKECPHLLAIEKTAQFKPEDIDVAKAWTCAAHIVSTGGDSANEGFMLTTGDRMFWDNVHASLASVIPHHE